MHTTEAIEPVTALKTRSAQLIKAARESRRPVIITQNGKASAVLQDAESYEEQRQALFLLKILAQGDQAIMRGEGIPHAEVRRNLGKKLKGMRDA